MAATESPRDAARVGVDAGERAPAGRRGTEVRRDRDPDGRARNSRPRDELGRPLPYGSPAVPRAPEGVLRTPDETITQAQELLDGGLPFHAHEVFEDAWKAAGSAGVTTDGEPPVDDPSTAADRALWKGLAQVAVGLTHLARGNNNRGAQTLLRRGAAAVAPYQLQQPYGLDIGGIVSWATDLADGLGSSDPAAQVDNSWTPPRLRARQPGDPAMPGSG